MDKLKRLRGRLESLLDRLLDFGDRLHQQAREESDAFNANSLRADAELVHEARKEIWERHQGDTVKHFSDDSVHGNHAPVQITRFSLPKDAREIIVSVVMAVAVLTSLVLWSKLHDAEKDIQTQIWLRDDALTKFEQGPYADLKAHVIALEMTCKEK